MTQSSQSEGTDTKAQKDMWAIAHMLLSHKDREVRDLAVVSIGLMRKQFPKEVTDD